MKYYFLFRLLVGSILLTALSACGSGQQIDKSNNSTSKAVYAATVTQSQSKVFISSASSEAFTVANSGVNLYGGLSSEVITINSGVNSVTLDQNIDRFNLPGDSSNYRYKQTGNMLVVYDNLGVTTIATFPVQGDDNGTQLGFSNGTYDAKIILGQIYIGGTAVSQSIPVQITPLTATSIGESTISATSTAGIFMANTDSFTVSNSGAKVYGANGTEVLTVTDGTSNITFDQNIEQLNFSGADTNYKFLQTGNLINIYHTNGSTLIAKGPVQGTSGTLLCFANGSGWVQMTTGGTMQLGGTTVSTTTPGIISAANNGSITIKW